MRGRRGVVITLIIFLSISPIMAKSSFSLGMTVNASRFYLSSEFKEVMKNLDTNLYNNGDATYLNTFGPGVEVLFIPSTRLPIGLYGGVNVDFVTAIDGGLYKSRNLDSRYGILLGLEYRESFSDTFGLYATLAYERSILNIATTNERNSKLDVDHVDFFSDGVYADLGVYSEYNIAYFKCGFSFYKGVSRDDFSLALSIAFGLNLQSL